MVERAVIPLSQLSRPQRALLLEAYVSAVVVTGQRVRAADALARLGLVACESVGGPYWRRERVTLTVAGKSVVARVLGNSRTRRTPAVW